jgi:peptidoglycan/LPS O-acetylase OafA/YrhL
MIPPKGAPAPGAVALSASAAAGAAPTPAPPGGLAPGWDADALDGLRGAACAAVVAFHALLLWGALADWDAGRAALAASAALRAAALGAAGVDVFLVLTGLFAVVALAPELEAAAAATRGDAAAELVALRGVARRYWRRRARRALAPYATALALAALGVDHSAVADLALAPNRSVVHAFCPTTLPLSLVVAQNLAGFAGCGVHLWSLAVQAHFWAAAPLALAAARPGARGFRRRVAAGAAVAFLGAAALRWAAAAAVSVRLPLPPWAHPAQGAADEDAAVRYYHVLYFSTPARTCNLAAGALLGLLAADARATAAVRARPRAAAAACLAALAAWAAAVGGGAAIAGAPWPPARAAAFAALAYHGSPLYCAAAAAAVLLPGLRLGPAGRAAAAALRSRPARALAALSFDVYLVHMVAVYWLEAWLLPRGALAALVARAPPAAGLAALAAATLGAGCVAGAAHAHAHAALERLWRRRRSKAA